MQETHDDVIREKNLPRVGDVHDERVVRRTAFGREDALNGLFGQGVGPEPVDCFRREAHQPPRTDHASRRLDRRRIRGIGRNLNDSGLSH